MVDSLHHDLHQPESSNSQKTPRGYWNKPNVHRRLDFHRSCRFYAEGILYP